MFTPSFKAFNNSHLSMLQEAAVNLHAGEWGDNFL